MHPRSEGGSVDSAADHRTVEVAVVGAGLAGLTAVTALASAGIETVLFAAPLQRTDNRTSALLTGSVNALATLGVWDFCRARAAPLRMIEIIDDTRRLLRAPPARFSAEELGLAAFGYNIENQHLATALETRAAQLPALQRLPYVAEALEVADDFVAVRYGGGKIVRAQLLIGADGGASVCRAAAHIPVDGVDYQQSALAVNIRHDRAHRDISTEFHTETGPFTLVPLPGNRSSVVYVLSSAAGARLAQLRFLAADGDR